MKFKYNQILYRDIIVIILIGLVFLITFGYFLGWKINPFNFLIYLSIIFGVIFLAILIYLILNLINKTYVYIDGEKILKIHKSKKKLILENKHILYAKYLNKVDFFDLTNPISELNCMEITYKRPDSSISNIRIYCSKKVYREIIERGYLPKY